MGWTFTHRNHGECSNEDWFCREFGDGRQGGRGIVKVAGRLGTSYAAYRTQEGEIIGVVILTQWRRGTWYNFGYKDIEENMGPCEADCPQSILDLLTPTNSEWANEWRGKCRAKLAKPKLKLTAGDTVRFARPITFTGGETFTELVCVNAKRLWFKVAEDRWGTYRLTRRSLEGAQIV